MGRQFIFEGQFRDAKTPSLSVMYDRKIFNLLRKDPVSRYKLQFMLSTDGQLDGKGRAAVVFAVNADRAFMFLDDIAGKRESQTRSGSFGGKERFEYLIAMFSRDAAAGIADLNGDLDIIREALDGDLPFFLDGLNGVQKNVQENLNDLLLIA